jgi:hypothetical protein
MGKESSESISSAMTFPNSIIIGPEEKSNRTKFVLYATSKNMTIWRKINFKTFYWLHITNFLKVLSSLVVRLCVN